MAMRTNYLNLIKPDYADAADIADINANMDALDKKIQGLDETGPKSLIAHNKATDAHNTMAATIDDTLVPTDDESAIRNLLSNLSNRIKATTGASGWKDNPAINLAALFTFVSNMASGSDVTWSGRKFTNRKLGITGLIDTNGYVAFGPNLGGLIIQWGKHAEAKESMSLLPLSISTCFITLVTPECFNGDTANARIGAGSRDNQVHITFDIAKVAYWLVIGRI